MRPLRLLMTPVALTIAVLLTTAPAKNCYAGEENVLNGSSQHSQEYRDAATTGLVRDKKICEMMGLRWIEWEGGGSNPFEETGKLYRCVGEFDMKITFVPPEPPPPPPPPPPPNPRDETPPSLQLIVNIGYLTDSYSDPDAAEFSQSIQSVYGTTHFTTVLGTKGQGKLRVTDTITLDLTGLWDGWKSGSMSSDEVVRKVFDATTASFTGRTVSPEFMSNISAAAVRGETQLQGNFCWQEAINFNRADKQFAGYGYYCGSGACYEGAAEECDYAYIRQTCYDTSCDKDGNCTTYSWDCSYCSGPQGDCAGCRAAEMEYNRTKQIWQACVGRMAAFLDMIHKTADAAVKAAYSNLSGGRL